MVLFLHYLNQLPCLIFNGFALVIQVDKRVLRAIGERPVMDDAGTNVNLTISSSHLVLTALETGRVLANHSMPHISFASGGDPVSKSSQFV